MSKLNDVTSQYKPGAVTSLENELILNWYPPRILRRLEGKAPLSLLELGLGHGYTTALFNRHFQRHVVLEGSSVVIDLFRENYPGLNIELVEGYFEHFVSSEQFDVVMMGFILEHVDDPGLILRRFRDNLRPGGSLYVAVPNAKSLNRRLGLAMGKIADIYELNANDHALGHQRQFCRDTLKALLQAEGYRVTWEEGIYLKPLPLGYMQTMPEFEENLQAMCEVGVDFPDLCVGLLMEVQVA
ncbi:class I SAM-dependent methyltransferase [Ectopseudomonas hydrolytica]|uniref:Class I SAM-dependent methyltransferase n=1 Tax=Ectopseudomonas hydrolytica TaxID=2493633 RepID=A0ABY5A350_9GAMM|nr:MULTISPECIES: class I SAM-dependent methyltransferase [Pseudomonas]MDH0095369.1 class I SAM-dependent methyltransferase [Pseudomonas sp. GD04158]USR37997.1 class I SAM-dependent methyltransferase [Pseudomonas hydrolytica]